jgi:AraC-like DNA-binding protein
MVMREKVMGSGAGWQVRIGRVRRRRKIPIKHRLNAAIHFAHNHDVYSADAPVPAFRHQVHRLSGPEQFGIAVSGATLTADFLSPQREPTIVEQFQAPDWTLDFHEAHVKARLFAPLPAGWASLGLMRSPAASAWYGVDAGKGMLACNPPGEPIDGWISPGFSCLAVNVPPAVWERCRALAGTDRGLTGFAAFHLPPPVYQRIERQLLATRHLLRAATDNPALAALAAHEAASFATEMVTDVCALVDRAAVPRDSFRNRIRLARRAESWMRGHLAEAVQVPDVCLALHVSRRELEYAFRTAFDQSPRAFLQALRLNAIRRVLRATGMAVTQVAFDHGITHLGRFAANYRSLFGESPGGTGRNNS